MLVEEFLPYPQHRDSTAYTEHEVRKIAFAKQFDVKQTTDECTRITAHDTHEEVHAAAFSLTTHDAVCYVADDDACEYRPSRESGDVF